MTQIYSPLPWYAMDDENPADIRDDSGETVALVHMTGHPLGIDKANGARIVSCVNGCEGIQTPHIDVPALVKAAAALHDAAGDYLEHAKERHFVALQAAMDKAAAVLARIDRTPTDDTGTATGGIELGGRYVSAVIRKGWEPRLSCFASLEDLRADALEYAREVVEIEALADAASLEEIRDELAGSGQSLHWGEC